MERKNKKLYYKIGEACRALDIQPYVLRYWETEFAVLAPSKSKSGQRVYTEKELDIIRRIKELLYDEGYTIAGAKKKLEGEMTLGVPAVAAIPEPAADDEEVASQAPAVPAPSHRGPRAPRAQNLPLPLAGEDAKARLARRRRIEQALSEARQILALLDRR
jgi:DNA-binding transcriptional MerR regulator